MKLLFASLPADGHFNPLTGLAVHLAARGHEVRWYTGPSYARKLADLGIEHLPFERATDVNGENIAERFPAYRDLGVGPKAIAFALEKVFFGNLEAHYRDICDLYPSFPFEAIVFDGGFYAGRLVAEKLRVGCYPIFPAPTPAPTSRQAPPPFFGLKPLRGPFGWVRDRLVRAMVESSMKGGMGILEKLRDAESMAPYEGSLFDFHVGVADAIFQVGVPGLDYPRNDWPSNFRFVGALLPHRAAEKSLPPSIADKLERYETLVAVSQGTIDNRDAEKLFIPTLEALRGSSHLVVAATGGRHTHTLRERFSDDNIVVEDWVDFDALLQKADAFVCNGGFGSVMHALVHGVPMVVAGKLEGKNDINARLAYRGAAIDLGTERPSARQVGRAVARAIGNARYRQSVDRIRQELADHRPFEIIEERLLADGSRRTAARADLVIAAYRMPPHEGEGA
jgi:UDP:flavonoid glycosyltransferase YjiC (YdhE family)